VTPGRRPEVAPRDHGGRDNLRTPENQHREPQPNGTRDHGQDRPVSPPHQAERAAQRPEGMRPEGARPQGTRPQGTRPEGTRTEGPRPGAQSEGARPGAGPRPAGGPGSHNGQHEGPHPGHDEPR
jgi:hypothetical protein